MRKIGILLAVFVLAAAWPAMAGQNTRSAAGENEQAQAAPPRPTIDLSRSELQQVQLALKTAGVAPDKVDGTWSDGTARALRTFQQQHGIDVSGHVDLMTVAALGLQPVLDGEPSSTAPATPAAGTGGTTPLYAGPAAVSRAQQALEAAAVKAKSEVTPGNILGVWHDGSARAAAAFQKAHGLAPTGTLDLELFHALGLDALLAQPAAARVPMLTVEQAPFAGVPLELGPAAVRLVQQALVRGGGHLAVDGHWKPEDVRALTAFQQAQHLEATGTLNLRTIRALGFTHPLVDLARAAGPSS